MFLMKHLSGAPKDLRAAVAEKPGLMMFILGRFAIVSVLKGDFLHLDPTGGQALDSVL